MKSVLKLVVFLFFYSILQSKVDIKQNVVFTSLFYITLLNLIFSMKNLSEIISILSFPLKTIGSYILLNTIVDLATLNLGYKPSSLFLSSQNIASMNLALFAGQLGLNAVKETVTSIFSLLWNSFKSIKVRNKLNRKKYNLNHISIDSVDKLGNNGLDFEYFISDLFKTSGDSFTTRELREMKNLPDSIMKSSGSGEQGVDVVVLLNDNITNEGNEYSGLLIQAKQYSSTVGNAAVQEIVGALNMYSKHFNRKFQPIVITNNFFSKSAKNLADSNNTILIDRDALLPLIENNRLDLYNIEEGFAA